MEVVANMLIICRLPTLFRKLVFPVSLPYEKETLRTGDPVHAYPQTPATAGDFSLY
jgi:hypothetical protein